MSTAAAPTAPGLLIAAANPGAVVGALGTVNPPPPHVGAAPGQAIAAGGSRSRHRDRYDTASSSPRRPGNGRRGTRLRCGGGAPNLGVAATQDPMEVLMESVPATRHQVSYQLIRHGLSTTWEDSIRPFSASRAAPAGRRQSGRGRWSGGSSRAGDRRRGSRSRHRTPFAGSARVILMSDS